MGEDSYPVQTMTGEQVRIVEKKSDAQRGEILVAEDGTEYVLDYASGLVMATVDAPLADPAPADPAPATDPVPVDPAPVQDPAPADSTTTDPAPTDPPPAA